MLILLLLVSAPIEVAITVDDLPRHGPDSPSHSPEAIADALLKAFAKHKVPQVYGFINAGKLALHPEDRQVFDKWTVAGYPLGNHTFNHADLDKAPVTAFIDNITENEPFITAKVFRYPFLHEGHTLATRQAVRDYLQAHGYRIAQVTVEPFDWAYTPPYSRCLDKRDDTAAAALRAAFLFEARASLRYAEVESQVLVGRPIKQILLLHLGSIDADTIEELLTQYEKANVRWISFDEAMQDPVYSQDTRVPEGDMLLAQLFRARGASGPPEPHTHTKLFDQICK